jgi:hypothetical protein
MPTSLPFWTGQPLAYPAVQKSGAAAVSSVAQLPDNFDIGLVQAAHDGARYVIHDNFVEGIDRRTIRVINDSWPANARARAARIAQKFPEFTVDLSVLHD